MEAINTIPEDESLNLSGISITNNTKGMVGVRVEKDGSNLNVFIYEVETF